MEDEIQDVPAEERQMHKNHITLLIEGIVLLIIGAILVIAPDTGMGLVAAALGVLISFDGINRSIKAFKYSDTGIVLKIIPIVETALGILIICFSFIIGKELAVILIFILGILLILIALLRFMDFFRSERAEKRFPFDALFTLGLGILFLIIPRIASQLIIRLLGLIPLISGIIFIRLAFSQKDRIIR